MECIPLSLNALLALPICEFILVLFPVKYNSSASKEHRSMQNVSLFHTFFHFRPTRLQAKPREGWILISSVPICSRHPFALIAFPILATWTNAFANVSISGPNFHFFSRVLSLPSGSVLVDRVITLKLIELRVMLIWFNFKVIITECSQQ